MRKRRQAKLREFHNELWQRMHDPIPKQGAYLRSVVAGHIRYYGVPMNGASISVFRKEVCRIWLKVLRRRSHQHNLPWERMQRLITRWIPLARVCHPYPLKRLGVIT
jgi:RNA-directed DNA polymerase